MKKYICALLAPLILLSCNLGGNENKPEITVADSTMSKFRHEAIILASAIQRKDSTVFRAKVDSVLVSQFINDMVSIYKAQESFRKLYDVCQYKDHNEAVTPSFTAIFQNRDSSGSVNDSALNFMMQKYGLTILRCVYSSPNTFVDLISPDSLISSIINREYKSIQKDVFAYLIAGNFVVGGGDWTSLNISGNEKTYQFTVSWGDCPSGCTSGHTWTYKIIGSSVIFVGEDGDPMTGWNPNF